MNKLIRFIATGLFFTFSTAYAGIERVSVSSTGQQGNDETGFQSSTSADGRFVVFSSKASNLVVDDTNGIEDLFFHDRNTGMTERINVSSTGEQANDHPSRFSSRGHSSISDDGRFIVYSSPASNLVPDDTNNEVDVFVYDRETNVTERVSVSSNGSQSSGADISRRSTNISADGRFVLYSSQADNLVDGDNNNVRDVFVHDRDTRITERVSVSSNGAEGNASAVREMLISADGRFVYFASEASNLVDDDTNNSIDVFVYDRDTRVIERVGDGLGHFARNSVDVSADGRFLVYQSDENNLVPGDMNGRTDIFVYNIQTNETELIPIPYEPSVSERISLIPLISGDGRFIAITYLREHQGTGVIRVDGHVHDRTTGRTVLVTTGLDGIQPANAAAFINFISTDGRYLSINTVASNLVEDDTNFRRDIFVADNPLADSNSELITIEVLINGKARETLGDAAQMLTGTLYEVSYKVTNNSPDRLTGVQIFEDGDLVCDVYALDPGQTKQRSRCKTSRTVLSGDNQLHPIVTGKVSGAPTRLTNDTDAYYTGIDNASGELRVTHRINNINADRKSQAPTLGSSQASVSFKIENTSDIELYRVKTYHDPASPVNSGWDQQCFIGILKPGQIRYCKRDISLSNSGLNRALGWAQGKRSFVSPTGSVNAYNQTYFIVP